MQNSNNYPPRMSFDHSCLGERLLGRERLGVDYVTPSHPAPPPTTDTIAATLAWPSLTSTLSYLIPSPLFPWLTTRRQLHILLPHPCVLPHRPNNALCLWVDPYAKCLPTKILKPRLQPELRSLGGIWQRREATEASVPVVRGYAVVTTRR